MTKDYIFEVARDDWLYKGILFAEADNKEIQDDCPFPKDDRFVTGIMGLIWVDEQGIWRGKIRLKFPSGNKICANVDGEKDWNETKILTGFYKFPMINKRWYPNPDGSKEGILKIMQESNMIESMVRINNDI